MSARNYNRGLVYHESDTTSLPETKDFAAVQALIEIMHGFHKDQSWPASRLSIAEVRTASPLLFPAGIRTARMGARGSVASGSAHVRVGGNRARLLTAGFAARLQTQPALAIPCRRPLPLTAGRRGYSRRPERLISACDGAVTG
ncbi:hypothetical protein SKAU_G00198670 [Synaphobranchus kaupii]|uniref:Uncharacterized protein n=1 Tax=Synaphobranchus kaupii TaxID=118154 RepID=A0A9Q1FFH2_SYNKA|nr:hypothetical protein SKAU_G00198670 [Synaphobranchus kaupii]